MRRRTKQSGMSLIEVIITLAITSTLLLIIYALVEDSIKAAMFGESHNDMTIMTQRVVNHLQTEVLQSRVTFQEDAVGAAYRAALQIPPSPVVWPGSLLPVFQTATTLDPDAGPGPDRRADNTLLIARALEPLSIMYDDDNDPSTPDVEMLIDRYRFEYYYLVVNNARSFAHTGFYLDLMETRSADFADYFQLSTLTSSQMKLIVPKVQAAGISRAWDTSQPVANAFYDLAPAAAGAFSVPLNNPKIAVVKSATLLPEMRGGRITGTMEYSIGFIPDPPKTAFPITYPLFFYAKPDPTTPKFPGGFEVKIAGPTGNRRVGVRLVMMSLYRASTYESQQASITASAKF